MAAKLRPIIEAEAKERQREAGKRGIEGGRGKKKTLSKNLAKGSTDRHAKETDARVAKAVVASGDKALVAEMDRTRRFRPD